MAVDHLVIGQSDDAEIIHFIAINMKKDSMVILYIFFTFSNKVNR